MAALWKLPVRLHHREQPLRHGHRARARVGHPRHLRARRRVRHAARSSATGRTCFAVREAVGEAVERARKERHADAARDPHLPLHGPLDVRRGERHVPHEGGARGVHEARSRSRCCARAWRRTASSPTSSSQEMDEEIKAVVQDAWDFADASPELPLEALLRGRPRRHHDLSHHDARHHIPRRAQRGASARRCSATTASSSWARKSPSTRAPTRCRRDCSRSSARCASSTRRSPSSASPASASARRWSACAPSSSS